MSEYSYNYSGGADGYPDGPAHFLDHSLPFSFEIERLDVQKTPPEAIPTNYTELEMLRQVEEGTRGRGLL